MYKDAKNEYYDWNGRPLAIPLDGGPAQLYKDGQWADPPGDHWPPERYLQPGGDASPIEDKAELEALMAECDARGGGADVA